MTKLILSKDDLRVFEQRAPVRDIGAIFDAVIILGDNLEVGRTTGTHRVAHPRFSGVGNLCAVETEFMLKAVWGVNLMDYVGVAFGTVRDSLYDCD